MNRVFGVPREMTEHNYSKTSQITAAGLTTTITIDWSNAAEIPAGHNFVFISDYGISTTTIGTQANRIVFGSLVKGSMTAAVGAGISVPMIVNLSTPLRFKRADGNVVVTFSTSQSGVNPCDCWIQGFTTE